jgi:hypothetical protein
MAGPQILGCKRAFARLQPKIWEVTTAIPKETLFKPIYFVDRRPGAIYFLFFQVSLYGKPDGKLSIYLFILI